MLMTILGMKKQDIYITAITGCSLYSKCSLLVVLMSAGHFVAFLKKGCRIKEAKLITDGKRDNIL